MAESSIEIEANVTPAGNLVDDLFERIPQDQRFTRIVYEKYFPIAVMGGDAQEVKFEMRAKPFPNCYLLSDILIGAKLNIYKSDGKTLPAKSSTVSTINNSLHSLFSTCELAINNQTVNSSNANFYFYKAFFSTLFTFSSEVKLTWLEPTAGWAEDEFTSALPSLSTGASARTKYFKKDHIIDGEFTTEGAHFLSKLYHELCGCERILPSNLTVTITLTRNRDSRYLFVNNDAAKADTEKYVTNLKV